MQVLRALRQVVCSVAANRLNSDMYSVVWQSLHAQKSADIESKIASAFLGRFAL